MHIAPGGIVTAAPYILARTMADAHAFANNELGLPYGKYRVVNSSGTLKSARNVDLYLVPGWKRRFDRFAMQSAIRWTRMNVINVELRAEAPAEPAIENEWVSITPEEVDAFFELLDAENTALDDLAELADDPEVTAAVDAKKEHNETAREAVDKRRRRRCKGCGSLFSPDEIEEHSKTHEDD